MLELQPCDRSSATHVLLPHRGQRTRTTPGPLQGTRSPRLRESGAVRNAWVLVTIATLLTGCGADTSPSEGPAAGPVTTSAPGSGTAALDEVNGWCDTFSDLTRDTAATADELRAAADSAPGEIADAMGIVASTAPLSPRRGFEAVAQVDAWAHENCGAAHPFCDAWIQYNGLLGGIALSGGSDEDESWSWEEHQDLFEVVLAYAPKDLEPQLHAYSQSLLPEITEAQERAAEAAADDADSWVEDNCGTSD